MKPGEVRQGLRATALCFGDGETPPLRDGAIVLEHGRIAAIGPASELQARYPELQFRPWQAVLTPGLVNAHTHLELSALRGQVPGGRGFVPWLSELQSRRALAEQDTEAVGEAVSALLRSGTVAIGEVSNSLAAVPDLSGLPLYVCLFHEVYGVAEAAAKRTLALARAARAALDPLPPNMRYTLSPHTLYSMHPELLRQVVAEARQNQARVSLHLAEHAAERAYLERDAGPLLDYLQRMGIERAEPAPGLDPVAYAEKLGLLGPEVIVVHLADARSTEIQLVAASGSPVVLCPRSNLHIEVRLPPLTEVLQAGIRPALGTDSLASCPSLDVLDDAQALAQRFPQVPARTLLAMATGYGADALGLQDRVGRLAVGLSPGILAFPHGATAPSDPERHVLNHRVAEARSWACPPTVSSLTGGEGTACG